MSVEAALDRLRRELGGQLVAERRLPAEPERLATLDPPLPPALETALASRGIDALWSHQAAALAAARGGRDVLLTTATASGKSLVFQAPVLEEALAGGSGRALWLFPLKALGQDQRAKLRALAAAAGLPEETARCEIYDGDTPAAKRAAIRRDPPRVLVSNPEMVHLGLLPYAESWRELLAELRWIVLDELHVYRGLFGSHFHHVLVRLQRAARAAGANPSIVAASATAADADAFAASLAGRRFDWVRDSGAPRAARHFLLVRPDASPYTAALSAYTTLVRSGAKTIAFTKARRITELLRAWLERRDPEVARRTRSYRAGYLPEERREIERALFTGELDGVLSTSALELGIDIGGLDACVLVGYPGSAMATWQRAGRVGRGGDESIVVLVALPDALDQYLLDHPDELLGRPLERLVLDPDNEAVARAHLVCAAAEQPLLLTEDAGYLERFAPVVGELLEEGRLARTADGGALVALARRPHREVSLRGIGASFVIVDARSGESVGTVDSARVYGECHPGAIYLHAGRQYAVGELDLERRIVRVEPAEVDWYTTPRSEKETEILEILAVRTAGSLEAGFGRLEVTERVVGYERRRTQSSEALDVQPLELPPVVYETQGLWLRSPAGAETDFAAAGANLLGALHAAEHTAIGLFPLVVLCDRNDLGGISLTSHPQLGGPGLFVYEGHAGGAGITRKGFELLPELLERVEALLASCPCESGCPSCVHSPKCGNGNRPLDKAGALDLVRRWLAAPAAPEARNEPATTASAARILPFPAGEPADGAGSPAEALEEIGFKTKNKTKTKTKTKTTTKSAEKGVGRGGLAPAGTSGSEGAVGWSDDPIAAGLAIGSEGRGEALDSRAAVSGSAAVGSDRAHRLPDPSIAAAVTPVDSTGIEASPVPAAAIETGSVSGLENVGAANPLPEATTLDPVSLPFSESLSSFSFSLTSTSSLDPSVAGVGRARRVAPSARGRAIRKTVLFDVETRRSAAEVGGWHLAHRMGVAVVVALHLEEGRFETYLEPEVGRFVAEMKGSERVVGFNSRRFDYAVLSGYTGEDYGRTLSESTLDLLESLRGKLRFRVGLDHVARETLGRGKTGDGLQSLEWVRQGRLDLVAAYCRDDVELLRDVYLHGRREGYVLVSTKSAGRIRVPVDW